MSDPFALVDGVAELAEAYVDRFLEELDKQMQDASGAPQRQKRAAYDAVANANPADYPAARAAFEQQYPGEWARQQRFGMRREERAQS